MTFWRAFVLAAAVLFAAASVAKAEYEVIAQTNIEYAQHDGTKLLADLYQPKGLAKAPAVIAVHGGGWQVGSRASYRYWGAVSRPERLCGAQHRLPARQGGYVSGLGL